MRVHRCKHCGDLTYPAHYTCRKCHNTEFEDHEILRGTLLTYTVITVPPPGVEAPLRIGIVEFAGGLRALGQLTDPLEIGAEVVAEWAVVRRLRGREYEGFKFRSEKQGRDEGA